MIRDLFAELHHRHVCRVSMAYAVTRSLPRVRVGLSLAGLSS
ncbi:hypothetical protein [Oleiagrimonas sp.]|jgi:hypothetical protein|nr:hypothetical protein [Oleiagrimonas sp.]MDA3913993.1 hypothetical protein [Oleiagrimonas sp.]